MRYLTPLPLEKKILDTAMLPCIPSLGYPFRTLSAYNCQKDRIHGFHYLSSNRDLLNAVCTVNVTMLRCGRRQSADCP